LKTILIAGLVLLLLNLPANFARAHGMWTYEPRQGRKAATAVCSASAVVTLAFLICDWRLAIDDLKALQPTLDSQIVIRKS